MTTKVEYTIVSSNIYTRIEVEEPTAERAMDELNVAKKRLAKQNTAD